MVSTLNLCTLGIERGNQPSPGFISIGRAKPSPAKHTVKDLALIDCHHRLPSLGSQLGVHENISNLWHQCQSKALSIQLKKNTSVDAMNSGEASNTVGCFISSLCKGRLSVPNSMNFRKTPEWGWGHFRSKKLCCAFSVKGKRYGHRFP